MTKRPYRRKEDNTLEKEYYPPVPVLSLTSGGAVIVRYIDKGKGKGLEPCFILLKHDSNLLVQTE
jgi:hypothetical protein